MPSLTINTSPPPQPSSSHPTTASNPVQPSSPTGPPYSPITPVLSTAIPSTSNGYTIAPPPPNSFVSHHSNPSASLPRNPPPPIPISESDNPDALALRSALSILQIQRQQTLRDLKKLDELKQEALAAPEEFVKAVREGKIKTADSGAMVVGPGLRVGEEDDSQAAGGEVDGKEGTVDEEMDDGAGGAVQASKFANIPAPQNIVRCPPIEWGKYHVLGEALDKIHEEQKRRPGGGADAVVAAPYDPFRDKLDGGTTTKGGKREG